MGELVIFRQRDVGARRVRLLPSNGALGEIALFTGVRYERAGEARDGAVHRGGSREPDGTAPGPQKQQA
jgi:hypothetical protein